MQWLNYHHLFYFWTVAKHGSIAQACKKLVLAQPTISAQIRDLERSLGEKLLERDGRGLKLTESGKLVFQYADEIFALGKEMTETLRGLPSGRPLRLTVGIADVMPKLVCFRLLKPALKLDPPVRIQCREDRPELLLAELAIHNLDLVLSDAPVPASVRVRAFSHLLGECAVSFMCTPALAKKYAGNFPKSLTGAPVLLPAENTALRRSMENWFESAGIFPQIRAEFDDSALLKVFGQEGAGVFAVPTVVEEEVKAQYRVVSIGRVDEVKERFYAISTERRLKHPAVLEILESARTTLF